MLNPIQNLRIPHSTELAIICKKPGHLKRNCTRWLKTPQGIEQTKAIKAEEPNQEDALVGYTSSPIRGRGRSQARQTSAPAQKATGQ